MWRAFRCREPSGGESLQVERAFRWREPSGAEILHVWRSFRCRSFRCGDPSGVLPCRVLLSPEGQPRCGEPSGVESLQVWRSFRCRSFRCRSFRYREPSGGESLQVCSHAGFSCHLINWQVLVVPGGLEGDVEHQIGCVNVIQCLEFGLRLCDRAPSHHHVVKGNEDCVVWVSL